MLVAEKYRLQRQLGWTNEAEVHSGPADATHGVPVAVGGGGGVEHVPAQHRDVPVAQEAQAGRGQARSPGAPAGPPPNHMPLGGAAA